MNIALLNPPWQHPTDPMRWGIRAGSRWPHFQPRAAPDALPRYVPFPFFLAISAHLLHQAGHQTLLLDGVAQNQTLPEFYHQVAGFNPDLIFIETATPSLRYDLKIMAELRRLCPQAKIAAGGTHPVNLVSDIMHKSQPEVLDYWLAGEYEYALTALTQTLAEGGDAQLLPGVLTRANQNNMPPPHTPDVHRLPMPLFEQLPIKNYSDPVCGLPAPVAQSWLSRGCPFNCTFCVWPQVIYGNRLYRPRQITRALDEIELLIKQYGCESFYFDDDTANIGADRMRNLAAAIKQRGLHHYPWSMMARADCMTAEMLDDLADAGMYSIKYGVESSAPALLNACDKGTQWDQLSSALQHTRELGIKMHLTFTLGVPGETWETINQTLDFAVATAPDTAQFSICTPFPGTAFYDECRRNGWLISEDWERFLGSDEAVVQTPWLSAADLTDGYRAALTAWQTFCAKRLRQKQERLTQRLRAAVSDNRSWRLTGERDYAAFIAALAPELKTRMAPDAPDDWTIPSDPQIVPVIVSQHDEEKIFRRWYRADTTIATRAIRLFS